MDKLTGLRWGLHVRRRTCVNGPRLPPELILKVIDHLVSEPTTDQAVQATYNSLVPLCLVSKWFSQVVVPLLYRHVVLPTEARADRFVRTVLAEEWGSRVGSWGPAGKIQSLSVKRTPQKENAAVYPGLFEGIWQDAVIKVALARIDSRQLDTLNFAHATLHLARLNYLDSEFSPICCCLKV